MTPFSAASASRGEGPTELDPIARFFHAEEIAGVRLATLGRLCSLAVLAVWIYAALDAREVWYYEGIVLAFGAVGVAAYAAAKSRYARPWMPYLVVALDFTALSATFLVPQQILHPEMAPQLILRGNQFVYFCLFLAGLAFSYSPRLVLWGGFMAALTWTAGVAWIVTRPETVLSNARRWSPELMARLFDPHFVDVFQRVGDVIVGLLVAGVLAGVVARSRRLVLRQAKAARERANLSRYFSPTMVDRLARMDRPLGSVRNQPVAVLFADIVGFTDLSEKEPPERVIALLREIHARLERAVFEHGGTLDKFLGDGVMATFGTPDTGPRDAANAMACARAMLDAVAGLNEQRRQVGEPGIRLSIGIHYGEVVLGDIGSERRLEFAVLGDVVNVASRLEHLTRELNGQLVISGDVMRALRVEAAEEAGHLLAEFRECEPQRIRGRREPIPVALLPIPGD